MPTSHPTEILLEQLHIAKKRAEDDLARIVKTIKAFGGSVSSARAAVTKRTLSKKARKAISDAQTKRWAKIRREKKAKAAKKGNPMHPVGKVAKAE